jgi:hypothetical protein
MQECNVIFYYDYPYFSEVTLSDYDVHRLDIDISREHSRKINAIEQYQTQLSVLFSNKALIDSIPEYEIYTGLEKNVRRWLA